MIGPILYLESQLLPGIAPGVVEANESIAGFAEFRNLAVQVLAALVGFYLATVGIVLGNAYQDESTSVRSVILANRDSRFYLQLLGWTIGAGAALAFIEAFGIVNAGVISTSFFGLFVALSGLAFARLANGAFQLMDPSFLSIEPLRTLDDSLSRLRKLPLPDDDEVLRANSLDARKAIDLLTEIAELAVERKSAGRSSLRQVVNALLSRLRQYSARKHLMAPTSGWFIDSPVYPSWFEAADLKRSRALESHLPLPPSFEPETDWFEKGIAKVAAIGIRACIVADDTKNARGIMANCIASARSLATGCRVEDALSFCRVLSDEIGEIDELNKTAGVIRVETPTLLHQAFAGWREAIELWPAEVKDAVARTNWDDSKTRLVHIKGTTRVWVAAQQLLKEVQAEHAVEGRRISPDWYLEYCLALECVLSLREFSSQFSEIVRGYMEFGAQESFSKETRAAFALQTIRMLQQVRLLAESIPRVVQELDRSLDGHVDMESPETAGLIASTTTLRRTAVTELSKLIVELEPTHSDSKPDLFGESIYTLLHCLEQEISTGQTELDPHWIRRLLAASWSFQTFVASKYQPPTFKSTPAVWDPMLDVLELSGLALIYEAIRNDQSAEPVRSAWKAWADAQKSPHDFVRAVLDILDAASSWLMPMSIRRTGWEERMVSSIDKAGMARPARFGIEGREERWNAPKIVKLLDISPSYRHVLIKPHALFAGIALAELGSEPEHQLRKRPGLRLFFEQLDLVSKWGTSESDEPQ